MSKRSIAITIWRAPELHAQLEQQLRRRPDGDFFYLIDEDERVSPVTDLLIGTAVTPCRIGDIPYHLPFATVTVPAEEVCDTFYLNYLLDELLYCREFYDLIVQDEEYNELSLGDIHTMTLARPDQLILHAAKGDLVITDPVTIEMLTHCPAFIKGRDNIYFSHHYTYYPQSQRPLIHWKSFRAHREAVQNYLQKASQAPQEAE